ncbi:hypothetical protein FSARC_5759 [Fusarium sarcochroum]|uniref:Uncharacterized protein n=1 Tax=Fusarium sarcochroum TaxID=1208366 RepID=A0A8H4TYS8_9HYPO|nr:hypothetical protein FSARC_5759 [Fusarium sarcochroum]
MATPRVLPDLYLELDEMTPNSMISSLDLNTPSSERELASDSPGDTCEGSSTTKPRMPDVRWYVEPFMKMHGICHRPEDLEEEESGFGLLCQFSWLSLSTFWSSNAQNEATADDPQPEQPKYVKCGESTGRIPPGYFLINRVVYMPRTPQ